MANCVATADSVSEERYSDTDTTLRILDAVARDGEKSQRAMAGETGVALGLANAYLRRCVRKGWIKIREVPARRYLYYITPQGFAEKARLTAEYLSSSFEMFRLARSECDEIIAACERLGYRTIALMGASDLAEVATLSAHGTAIEIVGIIDAKSNQPRLAGLPVVRSADTLGNVDAVIITDMTQPQRTHDEMVTTWGNERVFAPSMLRITRAAQQIRALEEAP